MPEPQPLPEAIAAAVGDESVLTGHEQRMRRSAGRSYPDLVRLRGGALERAPDAVVVPADAAEVARVLEVCAAEGVAVVPFGGGTSVVGGVDPLAGPHDRVIALDLRRMRDGRGRPDLADGHPRAGPARPRGRVGAGRARIHGRPFPAVVRVRDDRRLRRHPLRRAGLGRLRALRRDRHRGRAGDAIGNDADPGDAAHRGRAGPARARGRLRGHARGDHRGHGEGAPGARRAPLRGLGRAGLRRRARADPLARPGRRAPRRHPALRRGRDPGLARALGRRRRQARGARRVPEAAPAQRRLPGDLRLGGRVGVGRPPPSRLAAPPAPRWRRAARRGAGRAWERGRFDGPYLRDELMDLGYFVETLETSHTWSRLDDTLPGGRRRPRPRAARPGDARDRALPPLASVPRRRLALLHLRQPRPQRRRARAVARGQDRGLRGDRRRRRDDHPSPRRRHATTRPTWRRRWAGSGSRRCGRSRSASTRPGS